MGTVRGEGSMMVGVSRLATTAAAISFTLLLGACSQNSSFDLGLTTDTPKAADIATASPGISTEAELQKATAYWGEQHAKNPRDPKAAVAYARNLKAMGRKPNALSALQVTYAHASDDKELLSEYGRLALDLGQISTAEQLLIRAEDPAKPDWRLISARGTVFAKQGRFTEAIEFYEKALALSPSQASVLNNLAMAYTMNGEAARGEALLRQAANGASDDRIQKNLELVIGLQGKRPETSPTATAAVAQSAAPEAVARAPLQNASWNRPLPVEQPSKTAKAAARSVASASAAPNMSEDDIIRRAIEAEHAKGGQR